MVTTENYFLLSGKNAPKVASAFAPEATKLAHELIPDLDNTNELPFELELVELSAGKNGLIKKSDLEDLKQIWLDYQPNSLAWPLISEKLKNVIDNHLTGNENIDWIKAKLNGNGEQRIYYILRFNKMLDVLDMNKTIFIEGTDRVIKPCFSLPKIRKYSVFHQPSKHNLWKITSGLYINETLKKSLKTHGLTGLDFEKVSVAE